MIGMPRSALLAKKIHRSTTNTLKSCTSSINDPQISNLVYKLNSLTDEYQDHLNNPLNLMEWKRTKYWPTQSENRLMVENQVSMKKASKVSVRPRVKPVKRQCKSMELVRQSTMSYKEHYQKIAQEFNWRQGNYEDFESEEEQKIAVVKKPSPAKGIRFYDSVKKYKRVTSYIQSQISEKKEADKTNQLKLSCYSEFKKKRSVSETPHADKKESSARKPFSFSNQDCFLKIDSIVKKWKPASKADKTFAPTDSMKYRPKRHSMKEVRVAAELPLDTPRDGVNTPSLTTESKILK